MCSEQRNDDVNIEPVNPERTKKTRLRVRRVRVPKKLKPSCHLPQNLQLQPRFASEQSLIPSSRRHVVFLLVIPLLIALLQLEYQNKDVSPFDTHPINMWTLFPAACIYCWGQTINMEEYHYSKYYKIVEHVILSSGSLASVSLASVFLPRSLGWLCLALWTFLTIILAKHLIKRIYEWLKHATMKTVSQVFDRCNTFWGWFTSKKQSLPL